MDVGPVVEGCCCSDTATASTVPSVLPAAEGAETVVLPSWETGTGGREGCWSCVDWYPAGGEVLEEEEEGGMVAAGAGWEWGVGWEGWPGGAWIPDVAGEWD